MNRQGHRIRRVISIVALLFLLGGCSTMGASWPQQAASWKQDVAAGAGEKALVVAEKKAKKHDDNLLYSLEAGRIAQLVGDTSTSMKWFAKAADIYQSEDEAARIRLTGIAQNTAAIITNDRALSYHSEPYERIFSETFQALNYLAEGNDAGAAVEFRRVDHTQRYQVLQHQTDRKSVV